MERIKALIDKLHQQAEQQADASTLMVTVQILQEELAFKSEDGPSEKRTYQKAFITTMTTCSFSSAATHFNKAQAEAIKSMGFASFLKVDLKQIPGKFSKWLVESFDAYAVCFRLLDGQKFPITTFDVYVTLGVPFGGREII